MDAQHYYEICEALGSEPDDTEVPPNIEDLTYEAQMAIYLYQYLQDIWVSGMGVFFVGKNLQNLTELFDIFGVQKGSRIYILQFILIMDREIAKSRNSKIGSSDGKQHKTINN